MNMTRVLPFFIFILGASLSIQAQDLSKIDTGKYRIDLPAYWKPGNSIWHILNDKLPVVCDELKDKQLCGDDCNPKYIVAFEMTRPIIYDHYLGKVKSPDSSESWKSFAGRNYNFQASLLLLDNNGVLLTKFIIVDTNEVWMLYNKNAGQLKPKTITQDISQPIPPSVATPALAQAYAVSMNGDNRRDPLPIYNKRSYTIYEPSEGSDNNEVPTLTDLFAIFDKKIRSWK
jgi:hypothetical protein